MKFRVPPSLGHTMAEAIAICRDPRLLAWSLFIIFFPFYVVPNGLPQPAVWLLVVLMPSIFASWDGKLMTDTRRTLMALARFVLYAVIANLLWTVWVGKISVDLKDSFILSPLFYIFNLLLFFTILLLHRRYGLKFLWLTTRVILVSLGLQILVSLGGSSRMRSTNAFNEPNQLGYYGLLCACILLLGQRRTKMSTVAVLAGVTMASYLALLSASKAALASIAMLAIAILIGRLRTMIVAALVFVVLLVTPNPFSAALERAQERIDRDESHDFFEERGYDRIVNNPEYWVLGSGEGAYRRFKDTTVIGSHELHSSLGTMFFCYGIVGTVLFGIFMWFVMKRTPLQTWMVVGPAFAYGMTHQGLRFALMWVLLGVVVSLREEDKLAAAARKPVVRPVIAPKAAA
ncbi:MAG TPA: hypothetical protein VFQ53_09355 [Kofleriaceae bacterium]|nr:hypothetical protein [Kofleriaceae bacterium]